MSSALARRYAQSRTETLEFMKLRQDFIPDYFIPSPGVFIPNPRGGHSQPGRGDYAQVYDALWFLSNLLGVTYLGMSSTLSYRLSFSMTFPITSQVMMFEFSGTSSASLKARGGCADDIIKTKKDRKKL